MKQLNTNQPHSVSKTSLERSLIRAALLIVTVLSATLSPPSTSSPAELSLEQLFSRAHAELSYARSRVSRERRAARRRSARRAQGRTRHVHRSHTRRHTRRTRASSPSYQPRPRPAFYDHRQGLLELGATSYIPVQGHALTALSLGAGYRLDHFGVLVEGQFVRGQIGAELFDLNAQLRAYIPINHQLELFPLALFGVSHLMQARSSEHIDVGLGAQLKLNETLAVGARYQARLIGSQSELTSSNGHQLSALLSLTF